MSGYVQTFKVKDENKDKSNKLMSFPIDNEKLLEKYETIWSKIEDLQNIEYNASQVYDIYIYIERERILYIEYIYICMYIYIYMCIILYIE